MAKKKKADKEKKADKKKRIAVPDAAGEFHDEGKRLNRIIGQIEGIKHMLEDGRRLEDILIQCKAVHSALRSVESRLLHLHLDASLLRISRMEKRRDREEMLDDLLDLYKPVG